MELLRLVNGTASHDQVHRFLGSKLQTSTKWWQRVKPLVRETETDRGLLLFDDYIEEKPYTDETEIICWHFDHSKDRNVKGINFLSTLYCTDAVSIPVVVQPIAKPETYLDEKSGRLRRCSPKSKNEYYGKMLQVCMHNHLRFRYTE